MFEFSMKIECENDALVLDQNGTLNREALQLLILDVARQVCTSEGPLWPGDDGPIIDANGNKVGGWIYQ